MINIKKFLSDALFPPDFTCDICGIETFGGNICPDCLKTLTFNDEHTCPICGRKTILPGICMECKAHIPLFKKAVSPLVYDGGATVLIAKFKNGDGYLSEYFANLMAEAIKEMPKADGIVYVPMTKKAIVKRGYNQTELLANSLSKLINVPVLKDVVIKQKETDEQKSLSRKERAKNLEGCFKVENTDQIKGKKLLLVDDVLTTGATADAMCKKLLSAGADCVYFVTVASVEYKAKN